MDVLKINGDDDDDDDDDVMMMMMMMGILFQIGLDDMGFSR